MTDEIIKRIADAVQHIGEILIAFSIINFFLS